MYYIGIDIGSTCAKIAVLDSDKKWVYKAVRPTGWSSVDTAREIETALAEAGISVKDNPCVATGYGRVSVPYAKKSVTEITCHAKGAAWLYGCGEGTVIDIGGQDTKIIRLEQGMVSEFSMNDKCSAGTGRFLEVMANTLGMGPGEVCELARGGSGVSISSMCTVFAESEVISLIGRGEKKENIAFAIVDSIAHKVASQASQIAAGQKNVFLTGGLCECSYLRERLSQKLKCEIRTSEDGRYAGAIGAALSGT